jgi:LPXTG-site transpeptidase (sortase) family protein
MKPVTILEGRKILTRTRPILTRTRLTLTRTLIALALVAAGWGSSLSPAPSPVQAGVRPPLYVDTLADDPTADACTTQPLDCSLRGAISNANKYSEPDIIILPAGIYVIDGYDEEDKNLTGDLDILSGGGDLTILGESPSNTTLQARMDRLVDIPEIDSPILVTLKNMTLENGNPRGSLQDGGAIRAYASLTLVNVRIQNSYARFGGGVYFFPPYGGLLTVENSTFTHNTARVSGGGLYAMWETVDIRFSTFDNNRALQKGGAIYNNSRLSATSCTIFGNNAPEGAAIYNFAFLGDRTLAKLTSCTVFGNSSGIKNYANALEGPYTEAVTELRSTIVAGSYSENCTNTDTKSGVAQVVNGGNNIDSGVSCGMAWDKGSQSGVDPRFGPFQNNGGPTDTLELLEGSPAINKGSPTSCYHLDQRRLAREGVCDVGAYEYNARPYLTASGGAARSVQLGSLLGSPLKVSAVNALGNPLPGWLVHYSPETDGVVLSHDAAMTNDSGQAVVAAALADGVPGPATINATAGGVTVKFTLTTGWSAPGKFKALSLPATGFAPNRISELPIQPAEKTYDASGDLKLSIPKLKVSITLVGVPKTSDGWDLAWLWNQAGYLEGTAFPTRAGNSAVTAHVYLPNGKPGPFEKLGSLVYGDTVVVHAWGQKFTYAVQTSELVSPSDASVLRHEELPWLTLITCQGFDEASNSYRNRLAVRAVLVKVE